MNKTFTMFAAGAVAALTVAVATPASAETRVSVQLGAPVYSAPYVATPVAYYGAPRVYAPAYYGDRYDWRARREAEWRHREWLRQEELRREAWRREEWRREHWRRERGWDGHR